MYMFVNVSNLITSNISKRKTFNSQIPCASVLYHLIKTSQLFCFLLILSHSSIESLYSNLLTRPQTGYREIKRHCYLDHKLVGKAKNAVIVFLGW